MGVSPLGYQCRKHAPKEIEKRDCITSYPKTEKAIWPRVEDRDYCGDYKPKEKEDE